MTSLLPAILLFGWFNHSPTTNPLPPAPKLEKRLARVTYYVKEEGGKVGVNGQLLKEGHCAADLHIFPVGTKLTSEHTFPWGKKVTVVDTGPAVKSRLAARKSGKTTDQRKAIVIDVFCSSKAQRRAFIKKYPMFFYVYYERS